MPHGNFLATSHEMAGLDRYEAKRLVWQEMAEELKDAADPGERAEGERLASRYSLPPQRTPAQMGPRRRAGAGPVPGR